MDLDTGIYIYYLKVFKHPIIFLLFHAVSRIAVQHGVFNGEDVRNL